MTTLRTIDVYCVTCGEDGQADADTGKCVKCGRQTIRTTRETLAVGQQIIRGNGTAPVAPTTTPKPLKLTSTPATQRWIEQTTALAESFSKVAAEASERAAAATAEAERLRKAATAFRLLLTQVEVERGAESEQATKRDRKHGRWARNYDACVGCGTTERGHKAHGLCGRCLAKQAPA
jgi:hypothetical protein